MNPKHIIHIAILSLSLFGGIVHATPPSLLNTELVAAVWVEPKNNEKIEKARDQLVAWIHAKKLDPIKTKVFDGHPIVVRIKKGPAFQVQLKNPDKTIWVPLLKKEGSILIESPSGMQLFAIPRGETLDLSFAQEK